MAKIETSAPPTVARKSFCDLTGVQSAHREAVLGALVKSGDVGATAELLVVKVGALLAAMESATTPEAVLLLAAKLGGLYQTGGKGRNAAGLSLPVGRPKGS
jgi:hypothetical protein